MKNKRQNKILYLLLIIFSIAVIASCGEGEENGGNSLILVSVAVTPVNPSIAIGATQQFTATGTYSDNSTQNMTASVTWSSSDTTKATISNTGLATVVAAGTVTITATSGSISGNTTLTKLQEGHILDANTVVLWRLNEASASSDAADETVSYNLTQFGNPDIISGQIGNGRLLDGSTKFFQRLGDANLGTVFNGDWTYEGWVYLDPSFATAANLFIYNGLDFSITLADTILAEVGVTEGSKIYWHQWQTTSAFTEVLSNATLQTGQFYHIAVSRTALGENYYTYRLYVNGVIDTTTTDVLGLSYAVPGNLHYIGLGNYTHNVGLRFARNVLNGRLDDTRISNIARSDAEILQSYQRGQ
jgi:hypothetical protein